LSTYRVQLHAGFRFADAASITSYLARLGVSHLYCSPYFQSAPGSTHGYDIVDPQCFSEELGGEQGHDTLHTALVEAGLGEILDIVPNHMATHPTNPWWWDVLENGVSSPFAPFFDIDWERGDGRVLVPILGDRYGRIVEAGELSFERTAFGVRLRYHDHLLPVAPETLVGVLSAAARRPGREALAGFSERLVPRAAVGTARAARVGEQRAMRAVLRELDERCRADHPLAEALDSELAALATDADRLDGVLRHQHYRLAYWRVADEEVNYRRFFNITTLVGVRVEEPAVFAAAHRLILELVAQGVLDGVRVDHVDGLRDPRGYLARLAEGSDRCYTVVEKILGPDETLPDEFAVAGTSGYDFLNRVNNLFVATENEDAHSALYAEFSGEHDHYSSVVYRAKQDVMAHELAAEVDRLTDLLARICDDHRRHRDHTRRDLRSALRELVAGFTVYRTYVHPGDPPRDADRAHVVAARHNAVERCPHLDPELLRFLAELALGEHPGALEHEFAPRLEQLTAPVMAKGVEDTAFYRYNRFVSLNEVGGDPGVFGRPLAAFHADSIEAARRWPHSMCTLSTHDTKRSADVRARLNVLSEIPDAWRRAVERWAEHNAEHRRGRFPDGNAEYLLYQTLVGAWPIEPERLAAYMAKATKEAKVHTSWTDPDAAYDEAVAHFVHAILADPLFMEDVTAFLDAENIVERGWRNALAQVALLYCCPGVADLYQGNELWDVSLVDPDNRRPVDYAYRRTLLEAVGRDEPSDDEPATGAPKLRLVHALLGLRREDGAQLSAGEYEPGALAGPGTDDVLAFRRPGLVAVIPCRSAPHLSGTTLDLPSGHWRDIVTGVTRDSGRCDVDVLLAGFPVAVLRAEHV
jgi:(1->4)-alpha-D-glucan 1-alpha-D-glucosylmutase